MLLVFAVVGRLVTLVHIVSLRFVVVVVVHHHFLLLSQKTNLAWFKKKSQTELTASVLKKDPKHTRD